MLFLIWCTTVLFITKIFFKAQSTGGLCSACVREETPPSVSVCSGVRVSVSEEHCGAARRAEGRRSCQTVGTHSRRTENRAGWQVRVWATKWPWCSEHSGAMKGKERWWTCWPRTLTWSADVRLVYENCNLVFEYVNMSPVCCVTLTLVVIPCVHHQQACL